MRRRYQEPKCEEAAIQRTNLAGESTRMGTTRGSQGGSDGGEMRFGVRSQGPRLSKAGQGTSREFWSR